MPSLPLVVDLDGTLLKSDILIESGLSYLRQNLFCFFRPILWLCEGKVKLKHALAEQVTLDVTTLPYNEKVIAFIKNARQQGRSVILATASHKIYADQIANHLKLFDEVLATEDNINLSANIKCDVLVEKYGRGGFDYVGNSMDDIPVWKASRNIYVANPERGVLEAVKRLPDAKIEVLDEQKTTFTTWRKTLRLHQWIKNILMFIPLLASHQITQTSMLIDGVLAFIIFGLCASSVYLLNDLLDLSDDRRHKTKRHRMLASGRLPLKHAIIAFPILLATAFSASLLLLPIKFFFVLLAYYTITVAYSFYLKRIMAMDIIVLAVLYTLRIIAGAMALNLALTFWMLAFSMFIFLSLALVKRYTELRDSYLDGKNKKARGRGYYSDDCEILASLGTASGYIAVLVLALYIQDSATIHLYRYPKIIWLACPILLFWITRIWMLTHRGAIHDDPVIFAIKDRVSLITGLLFGITFWAAV